VIESKINDIKKWLEFVKKGLWENLGIPSPSYVMGELLEYLVCGDKDVNLKHLKEVTVFTGLNKEEKDMFWNALAKMTSGQRRLFLQFATGMMCIPPDQTTTFLYIDNHLFSIYELLN